MSESNRTKTERQNGKVQIERSKTKEYENLRLDNKTQHQHVKKNKPERQINMINNAVDPSRLRAIENRTT